MTASYGAADEEDDDEEDNDDDAGGYSRPPAPRPKVQVFRREDSARSSGPRGANNFPARGKRPKKEYLRDCKVRWQQINHGGISIKEVNQGLKDVEPESIPQHNFCPYCKYIFELEEIGDHIVSCAAKHRVEDDVEWTNVMNTDPSKYSGPTLAKLKQKGLLESQLEEDCILRPKPQPKSAWPQHPGLLYPTNPNNIPLNLPLPPRISEDGDVPQEGTHPATAPAIAVQTNNPPLSAPYTAGAALPTTPFDPTPLQAMLPVLEAVAGFVDKVRHQPAQRDMEVQTQKDYRGYAAEPPRSPQSGGVARYNWETEAWEGGAARRNPARQAVKEDGPDPALYAFHSSVRPAGHNAVVDAWREKRMTRQGDRKEQEAQRAVSREKQRLRHKLTGGNMNVYVEPAPFARPVPSVMAAAGLEEFPDRRPGPGGGFSAAQDPGRPYASLPPQPAGFGRAPSQDSYVDPPRPPDARPAAPPPPRPQSQPHAAPQPSYQHFYQPPSQPQRPHAFQAPQQPGPTHPQPRWSPTSQSSPARPHPGHEAAEFGSPLGAAGLPFPAEAAAPWYPGHDPAALDQPQYGRRRLALDSGDVMLAPHGGWTFSGSPPRERLHTKSKAMQEHQWTKSPLDKVVPPMKLGEGRPNPDRERSPSPPIDARRGRRAAPVPAPYAEYPEPPSQQPPPPGGWWSRLAPSWMGGGRASAGQAAPAAPAPLPGYTASQPVDVGYESAEEEEEYVQGPGPEYHAYHGPPPVEAETLDPVEAARARRMREMEAQRRDEYETAAAMDAVDGMLDHRRHSRESREPSGYEDVGRPIEDIDDERYEPAGRQAHRNREEDQRQGYEDEPWDDLAQRYRQDTDHRLSRPARGQESHAAAVDAYDGLAHADPRDDVAAEEFAEERHRKQQPAPKAQSAQTRSRSHDDVPVGPRGSAPTQLEDAGRGGRYDDRVPCASCGRMFAADRIDTHARICQKNAKKTTAKPGAAKRPPSALRSGPPGEGWGAAAAPATGPGSEYYPSGGAASYVSAPRYSATTESLLPDTRGRLYPYEASSYAIGSETPAYSRIPAQSSYIRPTTVYSEPASKYYPSYQTPVTRVPAYSRAPVFVESSDSVLTRDLAGSSRRYYPSYSYI
eukprot:EG_transcript_958